MSRRLSRARVEPVDRVGAVDRLEHGAQPRRHVGAGRDGERDAGIADPPLRPDEPLRHRRRLDGERAGDLRRVEAEHRLQHQRRADAGIDRRVRAGEQQLEPLVGDLARARRGWRRHPDRPRRARSPAAEQRRRAAGERSRSRRRFRATVTSHPSGLSGMPASGHVRSAFSKASARASSASATSRVAAAITARMPAVRRSRGALRGGASAAHRVRRSGHRVVERRPGAVDEPGAAGTDLDGAPARPTAPCRPSRSPRRGRRRRSRTCRRAAPSCRRTGRPGRAARRRRRAPWW